MLPLKLYYLFLNSTIKRFSFLKLFAEIKKKEFLPALFSQK